MAKRIKQTGKTKKRKALKITGFILLIIIIIISAMVLAVKLYIDEKLNKVQYEELSTDDLGINANMKDYRNIAILGLDSQYDTYDTEYRTDCIMIASINEKAKTLQLYSIYRDTYVQMELNGTTQMDKINHAYYGGVENTLKTINTNLDLDITEYVMADFNAVVDIVNAVGGIDIEIDSEELKYINNYIENVGNIVGKQSSKITTTGVKHLDGVQAMAYCRIRYTSGYDYKRTERMREVLGEVAKEAKDMVFNLSELNSLLNTILPKIRTNISSSKIISLATQVFSLEQKESFGWPYKTTGVEMRGDFFGPAASLESNVKKLHQEVYGQENYEVPDTIKEISNKIINETGVKDELTSD